MSNRIASPHRRQRNRSVILTGDGRPGQILSGRGPSLFALGAIATSRKVTPPETHGGALTVILVRRIRTGEAQLFKNLRLTALKESPPPHADSTGALGYVTAEGRNHDLLDAIDRRLDQWLREPNSTYYTALSRWRERGLPVACRSMCSGHSPASPACWFAATHSRVARLPASHLHQICHRSFVTAPKNERTARFI